MRHILWEDFKRDYWSGKKYCVRPNALHTPNRRENRFGLDKQLQTWLRKHKSGGYYTIVSEGRLSLIPERISVIKFDIIFTKETDAFLFNLIWG